MDTVFLSYFYLLLLAREVQKDHTSLWVKVDTKAAVMSAWVVCSFCLSAMIIMADCCPPHHRAQVSTKLTSSTCQLPCTQNHALNFLAICQEIASTSKPKPYWEESLPYMYVVTVNEILTQFKWLSFQWSASAGLFMVWELGAGIIIVSTSLLVAYLENIQFNIHNNQLLTGSYQTDPDLWLNTRRGENTITLPWAMSKISS